MAAATIYKITRRTSGAPGAPATLLAGQIAYNEADRYFYVGYGDDGAGNATSIKTFAADGFNLSQLIPAGGAAGQVLVKTGAADYALSWQTFNPGSSYTAGSGVSIAGGVIAVDPAVVALLASPALSGAPTAPTPAAGDNSTKIATMQALQTAISTLLGGAPPAALATLKELADAINDDNSYAAHVTTMLAAKLTAANNLSDLTNVAQALTNLGLGSMATQSAAAVAITGGTIDGVVLDGGTF